MTMDLLPPRVALQSALTSAVAPLASQMALTHAHNSPDLYVRMGTVVD